MRNGDAAVLPEQLGEQAALSLREVLAMLAQRHGDTSFPSYIRLCLPTKFQKCFDDELNDMKAVCHHLCLRKNAVSQAAKSGGQIHADDFDPVRAGHAPDTRQNGFNAFTFKNFVDGVIPQINECHRVFTPFMDGVFINAENVWQGILASLAKNLIITSMNHALDGTFGALVSLRQSFCSFTDSLHSIGADGGIEWGVAA